MFVLFRNHLLSAEFVHVKKWHLKDRLARVAQLLKDEHHPVAEQTAFTQLMEDLAPIRELRNYLAQGHTYVRLGPRTQKPTVTMFQAKDMGSGWMPGSTHVRFTKLLAGLRMLNELMAQFQSLTGFKEVEPL